MAVGGDAADTFIKSSALADRAVSGSVHTVTLPGKRRDCGPKLPGADSRAGTLAASPATELDGEGRGVPRAVCSGVRPPARPPFPAAGAADRRSARLSAPPQEPGMAFIRRWQQTGERWAVSQVHRRSEMEEGASSPGDPQSTRRTHQRRIPSLTP
ncbi:hypothetical protein AAFF_G00310010 [Aldrovandia affinis]|uniref:Uncharacterized protein n=1 Tax=Aldrovandia affinis TaxID=143900 RepID=A0AAD7SPV9_9TELE|nr:hypothetical protein AAFF_G00310010 [Aldrovandia affinis]